MLNLMADLLIAQLLKSGYLTYYFRVILHYFPCSDYSWKLKKFSVVNLPLLQKHSKVSQENEMEGEGKNSKQKQENYSKCLFYLRRISSP